MRINTLCFNFFERNIKSFNSIQNLNTLLNIFFEYTILDRKTDREIKKAIDFSLDMFLEIIFYFFKYLTLILINK